MQIRAVEAMGQVLIMVLLVATGIFRQLVVQTNTHAVARSDPDRRCHQGTFFGTWRGVVVNIAAQFHLILVPSLRVEEFGLGIVDFEIELLPCWVTSYFC